MNREQYLLVKLMEECAEIIQIASKSIRFGLHNYHPDVPHGQNNKYHLEQELIDVLAVLTVMYEEELLDSDAEVTDAEISKRIEKLEQYYDISREIGQATDE